MTEQDREGGAGDRDRLNLGCGFDQSPDYLNVDLDASVDPDQVVDLNETPWPWETNSVREVRMLNVIEHLDDIYTALQELHRIVEPGGVVDVAWPHWNSAGAWADPTHTRPITRETWDHDLVTDLFSVEHVSVSRVRWGRLFPERVALAIADHIGQGVDEVRVRARVIP